MNEEILRSMTEDEIKVLSNISSISVERLNEIKKTKATLKENIILNCYLSIK